MQTITQMTQLSTLLKNLRKAQKLSQAELGAKVGLSQERISTMENHPERLTLDNFFTLLMALNAEFAVGPKAMMIEPNMWHNLSSIDKPFIPNSLNTISDSQNNSEILPALKVRNVSESSTLYETAQALHRKLNDSSNSLSEYVKEFAHHSNQFPTSLTDKVKELTRNANKLPTTLSEQVRELTRNSLRLPTSTTEKVKELARNANELPITFSEQVSALVRELDKSNKLPPRDADEIARLVEALRQFDEKTDHTTGSVNSRTHAGYTNSRAIDDLTGNKKESW